MEFEFITQDWSGNVPVHEMAHDCDCLAAAKSVAGLKLAEYDTARVVIFTKGDPVWRMTKIGRELIEEPAMRDGLPHGVVMTKGGRA